MNKITAVVVTHNRLEKLKKCVDCLLNQDYPCDIIVADNDSTDGTGEWVTDLIFAPSEPSDNTEVSTDFCENEGLPDVSNGEKPSNMTGVIITKTGPCTISYFNTGGNLGGAGGFNAGMKYAYAQGYEYVWIMDDDAYPTPSALAELMHADEILKGPENYGYLGSIVLWTDGSECVMNRHGNAKRYYFYTDLLQYGIINTESSTFVSLLLPMRTIEKAGLPIKEYFIWGDDIEYTTRITQILKMPSFAVGKSIVIHDMKDNVGSDISRDDIGRLKNYGYAFRNENHHYRHRGVKGFVRYIMRCGINFIRIITRAKDHRMKRLGVFFSSVFKGFAFNPKIEYLTSDDISDKIDAL